VIDPLEAFAKYNIPVTGLLHIGANYASEAHSYIKIGPIPVIFFEPIPTVANAARKNTSRYSNMRVMEACCSDEDGVEVTFNVASNRGESSSMFALGLHQVLRPDIKYVSSFTIRTTRIETFLKKEITDSRKFNCAVIDTQGADLKVLRGFGSYLQNFDGLYVEVSDQSLYEGGATVRDVIEFLDKHGFSLMHLESVPQFSWGNALFVRRTPTYVDIVRKALSTNRPSRQSSIFKNRAEFVAAKGNDGSVVRGGIFHTEEEVNPWWEVDLLDIVHISGIYIFDRIGYGERSKNLVIELSDDKEFYRIAFARQDVTGVLGQNYFVILDDSARYVRVRLHGKGYLQLCQVAVV
jgi:FkbM family methyltransferase